jgi:membrane protease YdiL (CAAX protease family)
MERGKMIESRPDFSGRGSKLTAAIALLAGCSPILLDLVVPPLGIPAAVFAIWFILRKQGQSLSVAGVVKPYYSWFSTLFMGTGCALLLFTFGEFVYPPLLDLFGLQNQDISSLESMEGNNSLLAIYLTVAWTTAGFGEELIFRGFLMVGLARFLGMSRTAWVVAVIVSSIFFGLFHFRTGIGGILTTGLTGAILAGLFLLNRGSIWSTYIAHGLLNTINFLFIYSGLYKSLPSVS